MSVIRIKHNRENPYVTLNKSVLFDEDLSLKAKGLWAQCLARPDDWKFYIKEMIKHCREGRRAIYSAIDELIEKKYALRLEHYDKAEDGKFTNGGVEYIFFEFAISDEEKLVYIEEFKKSFRQCGFGNLRNGDLRNEPLLSKDTLPSKDENPPLVPRGIPLNGKKKNFQNPRSLGINPKALGTNPRALGTNPRSLRDLEITKEEAEEIHRRFKERPRNAPRIVSRKKWDQEVLKDIRIDSMAKEVDSKRFEKHKQQAMRHEGRQWVKDKDFRVIACANQVEFTYSSQIKIVSYDVSEEEWQRLTGWIKGY